MCACVRVPAYLRACVHECMCVACFCFVASEHSHVLVYTYGMGHKKFPFFETRYRATVILRSVFIFVPFYNFPCFYCCVSILKVRCKERLKNGKKNGAKNGVKTVQRSVYLSACTSLLVPR